jgi:hypothetical protein
MSQPATIIGDRTHPKQQCSENPTKNGFSEHLQALTVYKTLVDIDRLRTAAVVVRWLAGRRWRAHLAI